MTNLLDERIDLAPNYGLDTWAQSGAHFIPRAPRYEGTANTIVQLIRRSTSRVIAPSQPIRSDERHCKEPVRRKTMSIVDNALEANRNYAKNYDPTLNKRPAPTIVVVTCMDPRLSDLPGILGLPSRYRRHPNRRTCGNRRCSRGDYCFQPCARKQRDTACQPHWLRVHDIYR
jgi:hypothetical protein